MYIHVWETGMVIVGEGVFFMRGREGRARDELKNMVVWYLVCRIIKP